MQALVQHLINKMTTKGEHFGAAYMLEVQQLIKGKSVEEAHIIISEQRDILVEQMKEERGFTARHGELWTKKISLQRLLGE